MIGHSQREFLMMKMIGALLLSLALLLAACESGEKEAVNPTTVSTVAPEIVYEKGFFPLEKDDKAGTSWRWMGAEGVLKVKNIKRDMTLKLAGNVPLEPFPQPPTIAVFLNGEELEKFEATTGMMEKVYLIPAAKLGANEYAELKLTISKTFVPKDAVKGATDARALGFSLTNLTWQPK